MSAFGSCSFAPIETVTPLLGTGQDCRQASPVQYPPLPQPGLWNVCRMWFFSVVEKCVPGKDVILKAAYVAVNMSVIAEALPRTPIQPHTVTEPGCRDWFGLLPVPAFSDLGLFILRYDPKLPAQQQTAARIREKLRSTTEHLAMSQIFHSGVGDQVVITACFCCPPAGPKYN